MVMGEAAGTTQRKVFKIVRTDAGGFFGLTEWEGLPMDQFQGRFVDLMSPKPLTPEVIEVAKVMLAMKGLNEQRLRGGGDGDSLQSRATNCRANSTPVGQPLSQGRCNDVGHEHRPGFAT